MIECGFDERQRSRVKWSRKRRFVERLVSSRWKSWCFLDSATVESRCPGDLKRVFEQICTQSLEMNFREFVQLLAHITVDVERNDVLDARKFSMISRVS